MKNQSFLIIGLASCLNLTFLVNSAYSQSIKDSTSTSQSLLPRPRLEFGLGILSLYSDIGHLPNGISQSAELNWAYRAAIITPISKSFDLQLYALFGKMRANERMVNTAANLETFVRMGGMSVSYNFNALLPETRLITPYISLGISSFEFDPKGDNYDAEGRAYNYWSDGTIRSLPETDPNSVNAVMLLRDYSYETDLRLQSENEQTYSLRSFTVPLGIGATIDVSPAFAVRMGTEYHFSFTDNLDNMSAGKGEGRNGNDNMLYSSLGISYNLSHTKRSKYTGDEITEADLLALEYEDEDQDGVADLIDKCPFTPMDVPVDKFGCPLDSDGDGVADYSDLELNTALGAPVDSSGQTLSDEAIEAIYSKYIMGSRMNFDKSSLATADVTSKKSGIENQNGFIIEILGTEDLETGDVSRILSIKDVKASEQDGKMRYYVGTIADLGSAINRNNELKSIGLETRIMQSESGNLNLVSPEELAATGTSSTVSQASKDEVSFRVQIGAYRYRLSKNVFREVPDLLIVEGNDGVTRYVSGSFPTIQAAAEYKVDLLLKGFEGAFVTAYRNGERIKLSEAGARVTGSEENLKPAEPGEIEKSLVKFSVQVGSFDGRVPADVLGKFLSVGNVRPVRGDNGSTKYLYGQYQTLSEANAMISTLVSQGFTDAFVVGEFNGQVISAEEAQKIKQ